MRGLTTTASHELSKQRGESPVQAVPRQRRESFRCTQIFDAVAADVSSPDPDALLDWFLEEVGFYAASGIFDQLTHLLHRGLDDPAGQRRLIDSYGTS